MRRDHERLHRTRAARARPLTVAGPHLPEVGNWVDIHYRRPHSGITVYRQLVLESSDHCVVTFQSQAQVTAPVVVGGEAILTPESPVIWFTMPGVWHDIGIFHLADGRQTGIYANVLTPVRFEGPKSWSTTDLYLDIWIPTSGKPTILDEAELAEAVEDGSVPPEDAFRAKSEARTLMKEHRSKRWPPTMVQSWNVERARALWTLHEGDAGAPSGS